MWWNERMKEAFAHRLLKAMDERGWSQSDLAREASKQIKGLEVTRDNISRYIRKDSAPGAPKIEAIASALKIKISELVPPRSVDPALKAALPSDPIPLTLQEVGDGMYRLRLDEELPWEKIQEVLEIVRR